jgi:uncharacterized membrane protein YedE/YeeE
MSEPATRPSARVLVAALASGILFGLGLAISTMVKPESVLAFLQWSDFGLLLVLGGAVTVTLVAYQLAPRVLRRPLLTEKFDRHAGVLDRRTVVGAAIFGVGWGLCGVCPGPAIAGLGVGNWPTTLALAGILAGAYLHGRLFGK